MHNEIDVSAFLCSVQMLELFYAFGVITVEIEEIYLFRVAIDLIDQVIKLRPWVYTHFFTLKSLGFGVV